MHYHYDHKVVFVARLLILSIKTRCDEVFKESERRMITTTIKIHGLPQKRREIIQTIKGLAERLAKDDGCNNASIYQDLHDKNVFYLMEEWKTASDLEKYKKSKSLAVLLGLEALLVESLEIKHAVKCTSEMKRIEE